ncbi:MAG: asparaginase [Candidatus Krumholzibacteriota bacterium]|nr:asparaginase [Candidatus Krumholzibacteriota bacterium]
MDTNAWQDIARVTRNGSSESRHLGRAVLVDAAGRRRWALGDPEQPVWLRSAIKPFQALPFVALGLLERHGLHDEHLVLLCASHSGEDGQRRLVAEVLAALGLDESALRCGYRRPFDGAAMRRKIREDLPDSPLYHPCSGKHAGMLGLNLALGGGAADYTSAGAPAQRLIARVVGAFAGVTEPEPGLDGCGVPTFRLPLSGLAQAFARLAAGVTPPDLPRPELPWAAALRRVALAMAARPDLLGGSRRRLDSALVRATGGAVIAKDGMEGVECLALRGPGLGLAVKVRDGSPRPLGPFCCAFLSRFGILDDQAAAALAEWREGAQVTSGGQRTGSVEVPDDALPAGPPSAAPPV